MDSKEIVQCENSILLKCKDCYYSAKIDGGLWCDYLEMWVELHNYCSWGSEGKLEIDESERLL